MNHLTLDRFRQTLLDLLSEAYEGPAEDWTWFVTHGDPDAGVLGTLARFTAEQASTSATPGGHTIAGHAEHLRWSLAFAATYFRGEIPEQNWEQSWTVQTVNEAQWKQLQDALRQEYQTLHQAIQTHRDFSDDTFLHGALATVPHAAYHLGSIRQLARIVKA